MRRVTTVLLTLVGILLAGSHHVRASQQEKSRHTIEPFDDVRSKDLSKVDLSSRKGLIATLKFNEQTVWPEQAKMPPGSDPKKILADAMNPGLGVRELHRQGITGKGVNVAIIDFPLLPDHPEYDGRIVAYHDMGCGGEKSSMHGPAVASLLVGTNCGTAPGAKLYYAAAPSGKGDAAYFAKALDWITKQNASLPASKKIRVVSVSAAPSGPRFKKNREMWEPACARAEADGIMVIDGSDHRWFLDRCWYDVRDPESVSKCNPGVPDPEFRLGVDPAYIQVPASCRTTAQHYDFHGRNSYIYWGIGGESWTVPYCAGVLAMGWQVGPDMTPAQMKEMLFASAHVHVSGAKIIHPKAFIDLVRKQSDNQQADRNPSKDTLTLVRKAAAEGRISYKRTTPEEFKQIVGKPTKERVSKDREAVELEYPGALVMFFGKPHLNTPVTILWVECDGKYIDIGKDRYQKTSKVPSVQPFDKEQGKNPGLGVRRLHEKGITGRGVRVAILDQKLLVDHQEYAERVRFYEEIDLPVRMNPQMHGAAVASIAVGNTVGVAPEAELYFIAKKGGPRYVAQGINRILKINEQLPKDNKIRVISISTGWSSSVESYDDIMAACERAKAAGIFVVSCSLERVYGFSFHGLGRHPSADPDLFESYGPGLWWAKGFYDRGTGLRGSDRLLIPMDSRTTASPNGNDEYVFHREGGWSWSVPYIAGVYALAAQVEPDITPERFWSLAMQTGRSIELDHNGKKIPFGPIIGPVRLIRAIQAGESATLNRKQSSQSISKGVSEEGSETQTIVPGLGVGEYKLGMSKDEVETLSRSGKPEGMNFAMRDGVVKEIDVYSPPYKFANGFGAGDSEEKIKPAFGYDFQLREFETKDLLTYKNKGLQFKIHKKSATIEEITVFPPEGHSSNRPKPRLSGPDEVMAYANVAGKDVSTCDLRNSGDIVDTLVFNQGTVWPSSERLPEGFDPNSLLEASKNPGLGVRTLHARGITGAGVHVGLIDQPLLLDHPEYAGKIVSYHSDCGRHRSSMHGPAMTSLLVGRHCGAAPGARLHVEAVPSWKADAGYYAQALDRLVAYNENAPREEKIRVVSVSSQPSGEGSRYKNPALWDEAVQRAQAKGILVLDCTWHHGFVSLCWLDPKDRENVRACTPGFRDGPVEVDEDNIHAPSAPRTNATANDDSDRPFGYAYFGGGCRSTRAKAKNGYSATIPYVAGILALGWQIRPDLTPAQIKELLFKSAHVHQSGARIIHPVAFINLVGNQ